jgi:hypothetical protein
MKTYRGGGGISPPFLTSALDEPEWPASHPALPPEKEPTVSMADGAGWVGLRTGLDAVEKRKIPAAAGNRIPVVQPEIHRYID